MHICHSYNTAAHPDTSVRVERTSTGAYVVVLTNAMVSTYVEWRLSAPQAAALLRQLAAVMPLEEGRHDAA
jgi:hypothetical protein